MNLVSAYLAWHYRRFSRDQQKKIWLTPDEIIARVEASERRELYLGAAILLASILGLVALVVVLAVRH